MDEMTKNALNEFMRQAITAAQVGAQWTSDQAPLLVQEWLRWQIVEGLIWTLAFLGIALALAVFSLICRRKHVAERGDWIIGTTLLGVASVAFMLPTLTWGLHVVKVLMAPRVVVIEQLSRWLR